jgi:signal transduction histidine kinase
MQVNDVLIIDKDIKNLQLLTQVLSEDGYGVRVADNARSAVDFAFAKPPGLILLDAKTLEKDEADIFERLRRNERMDAVPIILMIAPEDVQDRILAFGAGGVDFIFEPITESEIRARVRVHMFLRNLRLHPGGSVADRTDQLEREMATADQAQRVSHEAEISAWVGWRRQSGSQPTSSEIAEMRLLERETRQQRETLAHASRRAAQGELLASIAHEINQPLAAIAANAFAVLSLSHKAEPDIQQIGYILEDVAADSGRAADVIRRRRELLRSKAPCRELLDLNELARETIEIARSELMTKGISLEYRLNFEPTLASGDRFQLQQVMLNILMNAGEATESINTGHCKIEVSADCQESGTARFAVRDYGPGVCEEHLDKVFDRFFSTKPEGLGMGLAISRTIVEAHGGRLTVENNDDLGATVGFSLPGGNPG